MMRFDSTNRIDRFGQIVSLVAIVAIVLMLVVAACRRIEDSQRQGSLFEGVAA